MPFEPQIIGGIQSPLVMPRYEKRIDEYDPDFVDALRWLSAHAQPCANEWRIDGARVATLRTRSGVEILEIFADMPKEQT